VWWACYIADRSNQKTPPSLSSAVNERKDFKSLTVDIIIRRYCTLISCQCRKSLVQIESRSKEKVGGRAGLYEG
jgi:hypothetical protein